MKTIFFFAALLPLHVIAQQPVRIALNEKPRPFKIKEGEQQLFSFQFPADKTYTIQVEQKGIDLELSLKDHTGKEVKHQDAPNGKYGPEKIDIKPSGNRNYTLVVSPLKEEGNATSGDFTVSVNENIAANPDTMLVVMLTPKQMKEDLRIYRDIREKGNSGLYRYRSKQSIDSIYKWANAQVNKPMNLLDFYKVLLPLADIEGSCHNSESLPYQPDLFLPKDKGYFPYFFKYIEGKIVMNNAGKEIPLGSRIVSINGISDTEIMKRFYKYHTTDGYNMTQKESRSVTHSFGWRFPVEFGVLDQYEVKYTLPYSDIVQTKTIRSISLAEKLVNQQQRHSTPYDSTLDFNVQDSYGFKMLNPSTGMISVRVFSMADGADDPKFMVWGNYLDSVFRLLKDKQVKNLVVDIRNNPGGNDPTYEKIFSYLTDKTFKENTLAYISFRKLPYPQYFVWGSTDKDNQQRELEQLEKDGLDRFPTEKNGHYYHNQKYNPIYYPDTTLGFKGNLYLLIDENVASAASHFASLARAYSNAVIVGNETTGGYYGHNGHFPVRYKLPNSGIISRFSIVWVEQDAPQKPNQPFGHGIMPDHRVLQSFDDFMNNRDTQLDYVLKLIGSPSK